jgi:hypothetical protein
MEISLLNKRQYQLDEKITVVIPTLREIRGTDFETGKDNDENEYYSVLQLFFTTPSDCIAPLHEMNIDFTTYTDYQLFLLLYSITDKEIIRKVSPLMFKTFNFADFEISENKNNGQIVLYNSIDDVVIDEFKYKWLSSVFCTMHMYTKKRRIIPGNETAKNYIIERALTKAKFNKKKKSTSHLDSLILAMVNNSNFKYDFETVYDLTIYDFNASVRQIVKKYQVDNLYHGIYSGCVDSSKIKERNLDWFTIDYSTVARKQQIKK